jgi:hypothetical protein
MLPLADSREGTVYLVLDPLCAVAFNTVDGWMRDVTVDIARELRFRGAGGREPTPMATLSYGGIFGDNSGGATPQRHRPSTRRPGDEPSLVRHGISVA